MLNLQAVQAEDEATREILRDCQNRVYSMALLHQNLYSSEDLAHLDFNQYIEDLCNHLKNIYIQDTEIDIDISNIDFEINTAIPCGLIIDELVTNSLKHAFLKKKNNKINISLSKLGNYYQLTVNDNGVGLPEDMDFRKEQSLGMELVVTLSKQLGGEITMENDDGATFRIKFPQEIEKTDKAGTHHYNQVKESISMRG